MSLTSTSLQTGSGIGEPNVQCHFVWFPALTFVQAVGLILTMRNVDYRFHDTEDET